MLPSKEKEDLEVHNIGKEDNKWLKQRQPHQPLIF